MFLLNNSDLIIGDNFSLLALWITVHVTVSWRNRLLHCRHLSLFTLQVYTMYTSTPFHVPGSWEILQQRSLQPCAASVHYVLKHPLPLYLDLEKFFSSDLIRLVQQNPHLSKIFHIFNIFHFWRERGNSVNNPGLCDDTNWKEFLASYISVYF